MSEPDWKAELRETVNRFAPGFDYEKEAALQAVLPHIEAAYQRGVMAERSRKGYATTRRKKKEKPKWYHLQPETATAGAAGSTPVLRTGADGEPPEGSAP